MNIDAYYRLRVRQTVVVDKNMVMWCKYMGCCDKLHHGVV